MKDTQHQMILNHLLTGARLTPLDALRWFGCSKLSTRCGEIQMVFNVTIQREWKEVKTRFGTKRVKEYFFKPIPKL